LLTDKYLQGDVPAASRAAQLRGSDWLASRLTDRRRRCLLELNEIARQRSQTLAQLALAWILHQPGVTSVLMGASSAAQIEENVATINNLSFSKDELDRIDAISVAMDDV
jgi:L-glyceraldehyde 3-phosphate reductase